MTEADGLLPNAPLLPIRRVTQGMWRADNLPPHDGLAYLASSEARSLPADLSRRGPYFGVEGSMVRHGTWTVMLFEDGESALEQGFRFVIVIHDGPNLSNHRRPLATVHRQVEDHPLLDLLGGGDLHPSIPPHGAPLAAFELLHVRPELAEHPLERRAFTLGRIGATRYRPGGMTKPRDAGRLGCGRRRYGPRPRLAARLLGALLLPLL